MLGASPLSPTRWLYSALQFHPMTVHFDEDKQNKRLAELRLKEEEDLAKLLAERYGLSYADLTRAPINTDALKLVPEEEAREAGLVVFDMVGKKLRIAAVSPKKDLADKKFRELKEAGYILEIFMTTSGGLNRALERYRELSYASEVGSGILDISDREVRETVSRVKKLSDISTLVTNALKEKKSFRTSRIFEIVLAGAIAIDASDVHFEPEENSVRLRYRLDGVLSDVATFDSPTYKLLLSRIKLISGVKLNIKNTPQDGRFSIKLPGRDGGADKDMEIRASLLPGAYSESIVLRLLNPETIEVPLEELGMSEVLLQLIAREIKKPNGMILNTGPTGSGKTTTLYACLRKINDPGVKIITIEDPIEYHLPGVVQTQVKGKDYTFAEGLRSALRQDPDVIMVGEIRDGETAEIAVNASLTGHLVLSTLHTNSAAGSFPRLLDLGVNPRVMSSAVNLALAQRLVRKLCAKCKKEIPIEGKSKDTIERIISRAGNRLAGLQKTKMWAPGVCQECNGLGYKGRIGIFEAIRMTEKVDASVQSNPSEREINKAAEEQNIATIAEDGIAKVLNGITTIEELERVADLS